jgi:hypothetical protein
MVIVQATKTGGGGKSEFFESADVRHITLG